jgi:hypothetical protein
VNVSGDDGSMQSDLAVTFASALCGFFLLVANKNLLAEQNDAGRSD